MGYITIRVVVRKGEIASMKAQHGIVGNNCGRYVVVGRMF
jgi:hypothetical protein